MRRRKRRGYPKRGRKNRRKKRRRIPSYGNSRGGIRL